MNVVAPHSTYLISVRLPRMLPWACVEAKYCTCRFQVEQEPKNDNIRLTKSYAELLYSTSSNASASKLHCSKLYVEQQLFNSGDHIWKVCTLIMVDLSWPLVHLLSYNSTTHSTLKPKRESSHNDPGALILLWRIQGAVVSKYIRLSPKT